MAFLGNSINISGKNRFLAESLYEKVRIYSIDGNPKPVIDTITNVDNNIWALSHGSILSNSASSGANFVIMAVPPIFSNDLKQVQDKWVSYKSAVKNILDSKKVRSQINSDLEEKKSQFVSVADNLTYILGNYGKEQVSDLILLQLLLLGINVVVHVFLLSVILNIIRRDLVQKLLIEQVSNNNKQLSVESKISILQKDILEAFLNDMKDDLQKLKAQVEVMDGFNESSNNKFVFHEMMHGLSIRIKHLAESKKELDDEISDYQKLNLKLAKSLSIISNSKNDTQKKKEDIIAIIQSYIDSVNFMMSNQNIPPNLGKRLTDTMYEIIDSLEQLKINK